MSTSTVDFDKNISIFIENQFPANFRQDGPLLVQFIKYYYEWLEKEGNVVDGLKKVSTYTDPDLTTDEFFEFLRLEFMKEIPVGLSVNKSNLLKNILNFYQSVGSEDSYRLLFRILFNTEINFYYPGVDILRASDGRWTVDRYMDIKDIISDDILNIPEVKGATSGATARIDRYEELTDSGNLPIHRLYVNNILGIFANGENLIDVRDDSIFAAVSSSGVITLPGYWAGTRGFISSDKRLQDNFYYQEYSYEIQSSLDVQKYKGVVANLVHPAGTKLFGKVLNEFSIDKNPNYNIMITYSLDWSSSLIIDNTYYDISTIENTIKEIKITMGEDYIVSGIGTLRLSNLPHEITEYHVFNDVSYPTTYTIPFSRVIKGAGTSFLSDLNKFVSTFEYKPKIVPITFNDIINEYTGFEFVKSFETNAIGILNQEYGYPDLEADGYSFAKPEEIATTGKLYKLGDTISDIGFFNIGDLSDVPCGIFGDNRLILGDKTNLIDSIAVYTKGNINLEFESRIYIDDTDNGVDDFYLISELISNNAILLQDDYPHASFSLADYLYTGFKNTDLDLISRDRLVVSGIGTISISENAVVGTDTVFIDQGFKDNSILEVNDPYLGITYVYVEEIISQTSITLKENYPSPVNDVSFKCFNI